MKRNSRRKQSPDTLPEYDFRGGERGRYAARYAMGTNIVALDPDVAREFPTQKSVNETLRLLSTIIRQHRGKESA
jgi:hypothetical protein